MTDTHDATSSDQDAFLDDLYELTFHVDLNKRYHDKLRQLYKRYLEMSQFISIILGSAAFGYWLGGSAPAVAFGISGLAVVIVNTAAKAFNWADKRHRHESNYRKYTELLGAIETHPNPDRVSMSTWRGVCRRIEREEDTVREVTAAIVHNQKLAFEGVGPDDAQWMHLPRWRRFLAPAFDFGGPGLQQADERTRQKMA